MTEKVFKQFDATRRQRANFKFVFGTSYLLINEWVMVPAAFLWSSQCEILQIWRPWTQLHIFEWAWKPSGVHKLTNTTLPSLLMTSLCSSAHMVTFKGGQNKDTVIAQQRRMCVWTGGLWIIKHMCCRSRRWKHYSPWSKLPHFRPI